MRTLAVLAGVLLCSSVSFAKTRPPRAPTNLTATTISTNQINLSWTDNSRNETTFKIERSLNGTTFVQIKAAGVNVTAYTDSGLQASTKYYYRVRAYNSRGNSGYSNTASATTLVQRQVYIAIRTDGLPGSGTQADPYNGSTMAKFDALMKSFQYTPNLGIYLGAGLFRTAAARPWRVNSGWLIVGAGMYATTVQLGGNASTISGSTCIQSDATVAADNVTISDLTVDCNWAELSATAPMGAGGEKNFVLNGVNIGGNNNLIQRVRSINSYGSSANSREHFAIGLASSGSANGTNNVIDSCRAEQPQGNYGSPFALVGRIPYLIVNSKVVSSTAVGVNNGVLTIFTSGGVNLTNVKNCVVDSNTFIDCQSASYQDSGSCDGLQVTNNTVIRGWKGVGMANSVLPKQNITISGNNFSIQNRVPGGGSFGIVTAYAAVTNLTINNNIITFDKTGLGMLQFYGLLVQPLITATTSNNTIGATPYEDTNIASGTSLIMFNNRSSDGSLIPGINNQ